MNRPRPPSSTGPPAQRPPISSRPRILRAALALAAVVGIIWLGYWFIQARINAWIIAQGNLIILLDAPLADQAASVERWVERTRAAWPRHPDALLEALYNAGPAASPQVRAMIERLARVNYADRARDWERWHDTRDADLGPDSPAVPAKERVTLKQRWQAPVGLTGWFSCPLALDGKIYIPSLGRALADESDLDDGVVIVDGTTGAAELIIAPVTPGHRDILGLSAGDERIFAVQKSGYVYALGRDAQQQWLTKAGDAATGPPASCDVNRDGVIDVIVPIQSGRAAALHGGNGKVLWRSDSTAARKQHVAEQTSATHQQATANELGAVLTLARDGPLWLTTPDGALANIDRHTGAIRYRHHHPAGALGGVLSHGSDARAATWLGDRQGRLWRLAHDSADRYALLAAGPPAGDGLSLVAGPRTLRQVAARALARPQRDPQRDGEPGPPGEPHPRREGDPGPPGEPFAARGPAEPSAQSPPLLLLCPTAQYLEGRASAWAINLSGTYWRVPVPGAVWAAPLIANLNQTPESEIILATIAPAGSDSGASGDDDRAGTARDDTIRGTLCILSARGHALAHLPLPAAVEATPFLADIDNDQRLELLVIDQSGNMTCFSTRSTGQVEWGSLAGDPHNTRDARNAFDFGQRPHGMQWSWRPQ